MYSNSVIPKIREKNIFVEIWGFSQLWALHPSLAFPIEHCNTVVV